MRGFKMRMALFFIVVGLWMIVDILTSSPWGTKDEFNSELIINIMCFIATCFTGIALVVDYFKREK